jgi:hypothetical protein
MTTTLEFGNTNSLVMRARSYRAPKSVVVWSCAACVVATVVIGFTWGGWVTNTTAAAMADRAAIAGQAKLAASICVDRFITSPDAGAQAARLKAAETWQRGDFIRQAGWLALPGRTEPVAGAADLCVQTILASVGSSD